MEIKNVHIKYLYHTSNDNVRQLGGGRHRYLSHEPNNTPVRKANARLPPFDFQKSPKERPSTYQMLITLYK
jgi:hypothetical protein